MEFKILGLLLTLSMKFWSKFILKTKFQFYKQLMIIITFLEPVLTLLIDMPHRDKFTVWFHLIICHFVELLLNSMGTG